MMYGGTAYYYLKGTKKQKRSWKEKFAYALAIAAGIGGYLLICGLIS